MYYLILAACMYIYMYMILCIHVHKSTPAVYSIGLVVGSSLWPPNGSLSVTQGLPHCRGTVSGSRCSSDWQVCGLSSHSGPSHTQGQTGNCVVSCLFYTLYQNSCSLIGGKETLTS